MDFAYYHLTKKSEARMSRNMEAHNFQCHTIERNAFQVAEEDGLIVVSIMNPKFNLRTYMVVPSLG